MIRFIIFRCTLVPYVCADKELDIHHQQIKPRGMNGVSKELPLQGVASSG